MSVPATMRAARLHRVATAGAPAEVRIDEIPVPEPGPDEVLVEVAACGVGASDLGVIDGTIGHGPLLPQTLGHEAAGTIAAVGDEIDDWRAGDRVALVTARPCGRCAFCLAARESLCERLAIPGIDADGAMAAYARAAAHHLVALPPSLPFAAAAILTDAVATPYHALKRGGVGEGVRVAIHGLGGLGIHAVELAQLAGASVVGVDLDPVALARATEWGADAVVDASQGGPAAEVHRLTDGGADVSFDFVGSAATLDEAVRSLRPGGRATIVGLSPEHVATVPISDFVAREIELVGSYASNRSDLEELVDLVEQGRLDLSRSVTTEIGLDGVADALSALATGARHPVRTVVTFSDETTG